MANRRVKKMKCVFRADASVQIGTGHVMRCLTLADELGRLGHECWFICREHEGHLGDLITNRGHMLTLLSSSVEDLTAGKGRGPDDYAAWLGVGWQNDAQQTLDAIKWLSADWLIVDHYALDAKWEKAVSAQIRNIMVIDDLANRQHHCSLLLDQNLGREALDYDGLVPASCLRLIGPQYALLRPEFAELRERSLKRRGMPELKRILITLGGVDRDNVTGRVLDAVVQSILPPETQLDVVMGASAPALDIVRYQAERLPFQASVSVNVADMAERMCMADLCIGAAGSTSWERCCLGLPCAMVVLAENQRGIGKALAQNGAAFLLAGEELPERLVSILNELIVSGSSLISLSARAKEICDGWGSIRLVEELSRSKVP